MFEKETPAGKKAYAAIMENLKTALFAEIKSLHSDFILSSNYVNLTLRNLNTDIGGRFAGITVKVDSANNYKMEFGVSDYSKSTAYTEIEEHESLFDSTTTLEDLRSWGFALPFDLDVKAFVANVIKPVVDEFLSKVQTGETETETPTPEPTPLDTESEAEPIAPIEPVQNETAEIDAEIESLKQLIGMPEFSDALDALLDKLEAAGLDSQYETVVSDIIIQDAQAESAKVGV